METANQNAQFPPYEFLSKKPKLIFILDISFFLFPVVLYATSLAQKKEAWGDGKNYTPTLQFYWYCQKGDIKSINIRVTVGFYQLLVWVSCTSVGPSVGHL